MVGYYAPVAGTAIEEGLGHRDGPMRLGFIFHALSRE